MKTRLQIACYHCGENCLNEDIAIQDKIFCCTGCRSVYSILNQHSLDAYYCLNESPGNTIKKVHASKFQFLEDEQTAAQLFSFKNNEFTQVQFYLPQIHCSSCLWLLENLFKLNDGIRSSQVNFRTKKVSISFFNDLISLRGVAELLTSIGYEPYITLQDYTEKEENQSNRGTIKKLGLVGFCFANIMLISFPEYLGLEMEENARLSMFFRHTNLALSLPVLLYGAQELFVNSFKSIKLKYINIDAPISLAIIITFSRSVYEIVSNTGAGYLDSMSGIVFFMLIGRFLQQKTSSHLKFNRDYRSYFPISVTKIIQGATKSININDVEVNDVLKMHHQEIVPVDGILSSKQAIIDYSFVTGENIPQKLVTGDLVYAGGKVMSESIHVVTLKTFEQNSFTTLWNNKAFESTTSSHQNFVDNLSKYFSLVLLVIASISFAYWQVVNPLNAWNAFTAVLIVACPCTLLLASSYTNGFIIELLSMQGLFVKNEHTLQKLADINHIVFDKTGTITEKNSQDVTLFAHQLKDDDLLLVLSVLQHATHPISKIICNYYSPKNYLDITHFKEVEGSGIEAWHQDKLIKIGRASYVGTIEVEDTKGSNCYFKIDNQVEGYFNVIHTVRSSVKNLLSNLMAYDISLLSGDNPSAKQQLAEIFPIHSQLRFQQTPQQKLDFVESMQSKGQKVLMVGDGINDAGALKQSDVGISIVEDTFSFSPASDAILQGEKIGELYKFLKASKLIKYFIIAMFIYSLLYNVIGLSYAVSGNLKPVIAAILMPASSISVILLAYLGTSFIYQKLFRNK